MTAKAQTDLLDRPTTATPQLETDSLALVVHRLAENPGVDVMKLEKIIELQERILKHGAEAAFNLAMSAAQTDMRPVAADASNPQTRSRYASYAALDRAMRPIYTKYGFGLSFDTGEGAPQSWVRVLCYVTHREGFARTYHADMPADGKGAKGGDVMTQTHAVGAAMSYGMRYLLKMIFNVAVGEDDRDGNDPDEKPAKPAPAGYDDWLLDLAIVAENGTAKLKATWDASKPEYRRHLTSTNPREWERIKVVGTKATAAAKVQS